MKKLILVCVFYTLTINVFCQYNYLKVIYPNKKAEYVPARWDYESGDTLEIESCFFYELINRSNTCINSTHTKIVINSDSEYVSTLNKIEYCSEGTKIRKPLPEVDFNKFTLLGLHEGGETQKLPYFYYLPKEDTYLYELRSISSRKLGVNLGYFPRIYWVLVPKIPSNKKVHFSNCSIVFNDGIFNWDKQ